MEALSVNHLSKEYSDVTVLKDISLTYEKGLVYGLAGENGAGKTTLFNCMANLTSYKGEVKRPASTTLGYLPAECFFYSLITGREYIEFCLRACGKKISEEYIDRINGKEFQLPLDRYASEYSTGMKKKLAIFALLLQDHDIYLLDEPFNGMDLSGCIRLKRLIVRLAEEERKTFIVSSHQIEVLHKMCTTLHYLHDGHIERTFTYESVEEIEQFILNRI